MCGKVFGSLVGPGVVLGPGKPNIIVEYLPISTLLDKVSPHGKPPHTAPMIIKGSTSVFAGFLPVSAVGLSLASCGHPMNTGAGTVYIGR